MKRLYTFLFLIFFSFQTSSLADDIRDFQIEGMSVGDSLLDYMSEEEIKDNIAVEDYFLFLLQKKNPVYYLQYLSLQSESLGYRPQKKVLRN